MSIRVVWSPSVPPDLRAIVEPYVAPVLPFVPTEYHELAVKWDDDHDQHAASMTTQRSYRRTTLTVCAAWLSADEPLRRHIIVHEVAHTITAPLALLCDRLADIAAPDEDDNTGPWRLHIHDANESVTQDVARHLMRLIPEWAE